jgi:hypothetical protein
VYLVCCMRINVAAVKSRDVFGIYEVESDGLHVYMRGSEEVVS